MFPETAGKTLEEVEALFTDPAGPKYIGTPAWKTHVSTREVLAQEKGLVDVEKAKVGYSTHHDSSSENRVSVDAPKQG